MNPFLEKLHEEQRERARHVPLLREAVVEASAAVLLVVSCAAFAQIGSVQPHLHLAELSGLVFAYAACWQVTFAIGPATTTPLQVAFVPMWFAVEPALLPLVVAVGQILGQVISSARSRELHHWSRSVICIGDSWYAMGPALVFAAFKPGAASLADAPIYVAALSSQFAFDGASASLRARLAVGIKPKEQIAILGWTWMVDAALAPIGLLAAVAPGHSAVMIVTVLPLVALLNQFAHDRDERIVKALELSRAYRGTAELMGDVLEADDAYTGGEHTQGVVALSLAVGKQLNLGPIAMRNLEFGALLHDVGKLRVPNEIINKPGKLTEEEWVVIREHPRHGQEMLQRVGGALSDVGTIVRAHHERWDGAGYPDGLAAGQIPVEARIITVCDSFSAMTTDRSYRRGMSPAEAYAELDRCSATQFDPAVVGALRHVLAAELEQAPASAA